jgi:hypothetical protein
LRCNRASSARADPSGVGIPFRPAPGDPRVIASGALHRVAYDVSAGTLNIELEPADEFAKDALLRIEQPAGRGAVGSVVPDRELEKQRGAYVVPLGPSPVSMLLVHIK